MLPRFSSPAVDAAAEGLIFGARWAGDDGGWGVGTERAASLSALVLRLVAWEEAEARGRGEMVCLPGQEEKKREEEEREEEEERLLLELACDVIGAGAEGGGGQRRAPWAGAGESPCRATTSAIAIVIHLPSHKDPHTSNDATP